MLRLILGALLLLVSTAARAQDVRSGTLEISGPWSRATPKGAKIGSGYVAIRNVGSTADRLVGGSIEPAKRVEVHTMTMDNGVMRMREVKNGLEIKPGETVELKPSSYHLMFIDLGQPLEQGQKVKGELRFEKAGSVPVEFEVRGVGGQTGRAGHSGH
jgi:copper(I)-binding protein